MTSKNEQANNQATARSRSSLVTIMPTGLNAVGATEEWEDIEIEVDTAATETVVEKGLLTEVDTTEEKHSDEEFCTK